MLLRGTSETRESCTTAAPGDRNSVRPRYLNPPVSSSPPPTYSSAGFYCTFDIVTTYTTCTASHDSSNPPDFSARPTKLAGSSLPQTGQRASGLSSCTTLSFKTLHQALHAPQGHPFRPFKPHLSPAFP